MTLVEVTTYHQMTAKVNPDNPGFAHFFRRPSPPYVEVYAVVGDGVMTWREKFKVTSLDVAEEQIKEVIQFFNDTRRPEEKERERTFLHIYTEDEEVSIYEDDAGMSGWLDPDGVFHPCGFGEHVEYAMNIVLKEHMEDASRPLRNGKEEVNNLIINQHIPMSVSNLSSGSFISILGRLTPPQVDWFNRFFFKLCPRTQRPVVVQAAREQGIKLKYDW